MEPRTKAPKRPSLTHWLDTGLGKLPPQAPEMEEAVIASCLLEKDAVTKVLDIVKPSDFYFEKHQYIFEAVISLYNAHSPIDLRTVNHQLRAMGKIEAIGGTDYLIELLQTISSTANVEYHSRVILEASLKRKLIAFASTILQKGYDDTTDALELLKDTETGIFNIAGHVKAGTDLTLAQQQLNTFKHHEHISKNKDGIVGIPSKWGALNKATGGYERGCTYVVAARPAMGKSLVAVNEGSYFVDMGYQVEFFSLEMNYIKQLERLWACRTEVLHKRIRLGLYQDDAAELLSIQNAIADLNTKGFVLTDVANINHQQIRSRCLKRKASTGLDVVIIDYVGLMEMPDDGRFMKSDLIAATTRALKVMAKELDIVVIELFQLSRKVDDRPGNHIPILSDLRDSGAIEQDADAVYYVYRPEYYKITALANGQSTKGLVQIVIAKNRNDKLDTIDLEFKPEVSQINDLFSGDVPKDQQLNAFAHANESEENAEIPF